MVKKRSFVDRCIEAPYAMVELHGLAALLTCTVLLYVSMKGVFQVKEFPFRGDVVTAT